MAKSKRRPVEVEAHIGGLQVASKGLDGGRATGARISNAF
jgi:hypothetical protein